MKFLNNVACLKTLCLVMVIWFWAHIFKPRVRGSGQSVQSQESRLFVAKVFWTRVLGKTKQLLTSWIFSRTAARTSDPVTISYTIHFSGNHVVLDIINPFKSQWSLYVPPV